MPNIVGPGSLQQDTIAPKPMLEGASELEYITILNPLTDDFQVQVAQDVPVNVPFQLSAPTSMVGDERDIVSQYGLQLKNPEHKARRPIYNTTIIPAGKTMNFKGSDAQVVVRQLVNEYLQREGKDRMLSDPTTRFEVERRIIIRRGSVQDILDERLTTPLQQVNEALNKSNEVTNEPFPGLGQSTEGIEPGSGIVGNASSTSEKRAPGRPKQT